MHIFEEISPLKAFLSSFRNNGKKIGLVPTMGALHEGHLSLIKAAKAHNDIVVCSIFVNPAQFTDPNDLKLYPRTPEADGNLLKQAGCDVLFMPSTAAMYPSKPILSIDFGYLEKVMEGAFREGHFKGVGLVVSKFFNIVEPDQAYFGQKDLQQFRVLSQLVQDLNFKVNLICAPIVREPDGLAMSSRNQRLSEQERLQAVQYSKALQKAGELLRAKHDLVEVKKFVHNFVAANDLLKLEYFEIVDSQSLLEVQQYAEGNTALCIAGFAGKVRLIDNIII